jgi:acetyl esterase/lipase
MNRLLVSFLLLLYVSLLPAQSDTIRLFPEGIPCANELTTQVRDRDIGIALSQVHEPEMLVYPALEREATGTAVIICPGGGYSGLAWDWEGTRMAEWFNSFGVTAFVLKYRLPRWESDECRSKVALMDAQRAMRIVRSRAEEWQLRSDQIGIMGFSAGGHLASTLSTHFDTGQTNAEQAVDQVSCRPDFSILMYPVITMDTAVAHMGSRRNLIGENPTAEMVLYYSNEEQITSQTPPTLLIHADDDRGVVPENSVRYYLKLREQGVPAAMHIFEKGGHGFSFGLGQGAVEKWRALCQDWMRDRGLL